MNVFSIGNQTIYFSRHLAACAIHILVHTIVTKLIFARFLVFFLVIVLFTKAIAVLISPPIDFILPVMSVSMKLHFLLSIITTHHNPQTSPHHFGFPCLACYIHSLPLLPSHLPHIHLHLLLPTILQTLSHQMLIHHQFVFAPSKTYIITPMHFHLFHPPPLPHALNNHPPLIQLSPQQHRRLCFLLQHQE